MSQINQIQADPDELGRAVAQIKSLVDDMSAHFEAIDQRLEELKDFWAGTQYYSFHSKHEANRESKDEALKKLKGYCDGALAAVPKCYSSLEDDIRSEVQKLTSKHAL